MKKLSKEDILHILHSIDDQLIEPAEVIIGGQSAMILQDMDFRSTIDIDLLNLPSKQFVVCSTKVNNYVFDYQAIGVIQLLEDYDARLIEIHDNFKNLIVKVVSLKDWVVSKLTSPKIDDVVANSEVTLELLVDIKSDMYKYTGLSMEKALTDLEFCIRDMTDKVDSQNHYDIFSNTSSFKDVGEETK